VAEKMEKLVITFESLNGQPTHEVIDQLTVGSLDGDAQISDPSISPKHCTFYFEDGVVSIVDHSSMSGTFIEGRKIAPGRTYLIDEEDQLLIGKVSVSMRLTSDEMPFLELESDDELVESVPPEIIQPPLDDGPLELDQSTSKIETSSSTSTHNTHSLFVLDPDKELGTSSTIESPAFEEVAPVEEVEKTIEFDKISHTFSDDGINLKEDLTGEISFDLVDEKKSFVSKVMSSLTRSKKDLVLEDDKEEFISYDDTVHDKNNFLSKIFKRKKSQKTNQTQVKFNKNKKEKVASSLMRLFALFGDFFIAMTLFNLFGDDLSIAPYISDVDGFLRSIVSSLHLNVLEPLFSAIELDKVYNIVKNLALRIHRDFLGHIIFFCLIRIITPLFFGVTITQFLIGLKGGAHIIKRHLLGPIREFIGLITGPFLIFDAPSLLQLKTFKEVVSFSPVYSKSLFSSFWRPLIFIPLLLIIAIFSPFFSSMELRKPMKVRHLKEKPVGEASTFFYDKGFNSYFPDNESLLYIPSISKKSEDTKSVYKNVLSIIQIDEGVMSKIFIDKKFSFPDLLSLYFNKSTIGKEHFAKLHHFYFGNSKLNYSKEELSKVNDEMKKFLTMVFEKDLYTSFDLLKVGELSFKGMIDFRDTLLGLFDGDVDKTETIVLNGQPFIRFTTKKGKTKEHQEVIIPILKQGYVFKNSYFSSKKFKTAQKKIYKQVFSKTKWYDKIISFDKKTFNPLNIYNKTFNFQENTTVTREEIKQLVTYLNPRIIKIMKNKRIKKFIPQVSYELKKFLLFVEKATKSIKDNTETKLSMQDLYKELVILNEALETQNLKLIEQNSHL